MLSSQNEFLPNQYPESASLELHGQIWNGQSHVVPSNAAPDPSWWTLNINADIYPDEVVVNQVPQESPIAFAGVSLQTPYAKEAGTPSIEAAFQTTSHPFGLCQKPFGINVPASSDIGFQQKAPPACPDDTNSKVFRNSTSPVQSCWNPTTSSSALRFDCGLRDKTGRVSNLLPIETFCQESQEKHKHQIPKLDPLECPHCRKRVFSERQLRSHVQKCKEHLQRPIKCDICGAGFTRSQDVGRHRESSSCLNGSAPKRPWVCTCGKDYPRKDRGLRHINRVIGSSEMAHTLQFTLA